MFGWVQRGCKTMAAKRGRKPGFTMSDEHRVKIQNSNLLNALIEHVEGSREMSSSQVTAGLGLLRKIMPDLAMVEHSGEVEHSYIARLPAPVADMDEWKKRYAPPTTVQ